MTNSTIQPAEVERDQYGYWTHPDYFEPANGNEYGMPGEFDAWIKANNLEIIEAWLECDDNAIELLEKYEAGDADISGWQPQQPSGYGWFVASIHDTEDGPICIWLRHAAPTQKEQSND
ncbi:hypothetical protein [Hafnia alvei]|uniref:hypothetical protein n=1 Tax=Hafnia alvei TaxID=569 RepID=UPI00103391A9|nr:hypothetical protein [Hafnia alvei]TBL96662.1 hypothetical protein EYY90_04825 [Hafnia alvei]